MENIKDIITEMRNASGKVDSKVGQNELFDVDKLETNPKKVLGDRHKYISKEYQLYGLRLASKLGDKGRATMYIKWAKEKPRSILEQALSFTSDYPKARDKSRIFMWKVKELEKDYKLKKK